MHKLFGKKQMAAAAQVKNNKPPKRLMWKNRQLLIRFLEFPSVKFLKIWQRRYSLLALPAFNLSEEFVRQGFRLAEKHKKC